MNLILIKLQDNIYIIQVNSYKNLFIHINYKLYF